MGDAASYRSVSLLRNQTDVTVYKEGTKIYAITKDGSLISSGTAGTGVDDVVINAAITATPAGGTLTIMPVSIANAYLIGAGSTNIPITKDITIFAYGATLKCDPLSVPIHTGTALFNVASTKSCAIYGMDIDCNFGTGIAFGATLSPNSATPGPYKLTFIDGKIRNIFSYGIITGNYNDTVNVNAELYVSNSYFDAGGVVSANECIAARCNQRVTIKDCVMFGNKALHLSSRYITLDNVWASGTGYTGLSEMSPCNSEFFDGRDIYMEDLALSIRPWLSMDGQTVFGDCKQGTLSGYTCVETASAFDNIQISGYDGVEIENFTFENFNLSRAPIILLPHYQATTGTIRNLTIRNGYINGVTSNLRILKDTNISVDLLTIDNIKVQSYSTITEAPLQFVTNKVTGISRDADITIGRLKMTNIMPESTQYIIRASDNASGVAKTVNVTMEEPLQNLSQQTITSGAVVLIVKFRKNRGKFTANGNASTTVFNIPHSLVATPNTNNVRVSAGHADSVGPFSISADATNIIVTYPTAPPTGTSNIVLFWSAETS